MAQTKNLCALIDLDLHQKITTAREQAGLTTAEYITNLLIEYFEMKENGGNQAMPNNNTRTMAFQKEFVLELIEQALDEAERQVQETLGETETRPAQEVGDEPGEAPGAD